MSDIHQRQHLQDPSACRCWLVVSEVDEETGRQTGNLHVYPANDLLLHECSDECVCGPTPELVNGWWNHVHHSLDGREAYEPR